MDRSRQIKVGVLDQHVVFTDCLGLVLGLRNYDCRAVDLPDHVGASAGVLARVADLRADVVLVNVDLGMHHDSAWIIGQLTRTRSAVIVLGEGLDDGLRGDCLARGARVVLSKEVGLMALVSVIRRLAQGEAVLSLADRQRMITLGRGRHEDLAELRTRLARLTAQEGEVLRHLMSGRSVREIARVRVVSEATVRTQVKAVLAKVETHSQLSAVAAARQAGWGGRDRSA